MQVEAFAIRLRRRAEMEAADLGVRLCQHAARSVFTCYLLVAGPVGGYNLQAAFSTGFVAGEAAARSALARD